MLGESMLVAARKLAVAKSEVKASSIFGACCTGANIFVGALLALIVLTGGSLPFAARAATVAGYSDTMSTTAASASSDHRILFVTPTGVDASTDTVALTFGSTGTFDLSGIGFGDIDLGYDATAPYGDCAGSFTEKTLAAAPAAGTWGVTVAGQVVTLTAPTDAAAGEIPAGNCVQIMIGQNAIHQSAGTNRIVNPATVGNRVLSLAGTFGDSGQAGLGIVASSDVIVTAVVESSGGGGPPPAVAPIIVNVRANNVAGTTADILWDTDIASSSSVDYGPTTAYGSTATAGSDVFNHQVGLTGLTGGITYHYRVRSTGVGTPEGTSGDYTFTTLDVTAPTISNVQATNVTGTTARIIWDTNEDSTSVVNYGFGEPYAYSATGTGMTNSHAVDLSGLTSGATYRFRVTSADAAGNSTTSVEFTFVTPDVTAPVISSISVDQITVNSARVNWQTNELATSSVTYGKTTVYGSNATSGSLVANHQIALTGLDANTTYRFLVSAADAAGNSATSTDQTFVTLADTTPPSNASSFTATPGDHQIQLTWINPTDSDFAGVAIRRSLTGYPTGPTQGTAVYSGTGTATVDSGLTPGVPHYYAAFAHDASGNYASGAVASAIPYDLIPPGPPTSFTVTPGPQQNALAWQNPLDLDFAAVIIRRSTTGYPTTPTDGDSVYAGSGTSHLDSGLTDGVTYYYSIWARDTSNNLSTTVHGQGQPSTPTPPVVCGDNTCSAGETHANCPADCPGLPPGPVCGDNVCDPGETYATCPADCSAPPPPPPPPVVPPSTTTPPTARLNADLVRYLAMNRTVRLTADAQGILHILPGRSFSVAVPLEALPKPVKSLVMNFGDGSYLFKRENSISVAVDSAGARGNWLFGVANAADPTVMDAYVADVQVPTSPQVVNGMIIATFEDDTTDLVTFNLRVVAYGHVYAMKDGAESPIAGVTVALQDSNGNLVDTAPYRQNNPLTTASDGLYGYVVPNGTYRLVLSGEGYRTYTTAPFQVGTEVISQKIELVAVPKSITEVIVPGAPLVDNIFNVARGVGDQASYVTKIFQKEIVEDPRVKTAATQVVAPATVAVTGVVVVTATNAVNVAWYLYYLITQPLLLLGRRRRREYGTVYNALTRLPIDLAAVRLFRSNGRLVRTIVTDKRGRYSFLVDAGEYRMEVSKQNLKFPSDILMSQREDGRYLDLYHGEIVKAGSDGAIIAANIPLDPIEEIKTARRLIMEDIWFRAQTVIGFTSTAAAILICLLYRQLYQILIAVGQVALFLLFRRLARSRPAKNWGIVYDESTKKPVPFAVARIIETKYQKVLESRVTDGRGRYNFLVGNSKYFVTVEKPGYETRKTDEIDLTTKKEGEGVIGLDIGIKPRSSAPPPEITRLRQGSGGQET